MADLIAGAVIFFGSCTALLVGLFWSATRNDEPRESVLFLDETTETVTWDAVYDQELDTADWVAWEAEVSA